MKNISCSIVYYRVCNFSDSPIVIENGTFAWSKSDDRPTLEKYGFYFETNILLFYQIHEIVEHFYIRHCLSLDYIFHSKS